MDAAILKENILLDASVNIREILEHIQCHQIRETLKEFRCALPEDDNWTKVRINKETLKSRVFGSAIDGEDGMYGDVISLVMYVSGIGFKGAMQTICTAIGIEYNGYQVAPKQASVFDSYFTYFNNLESGYYNQNVELETYDDSILDSYDIASNDLFIKDNIGADIQMRYGVRFFSERNTIVVPWRNPKGEIIGLMGRQNASTESCKKRGYAKWLPLKGYEFYKSQCIYGYCENYQSIQHFGAVLVGESEKAPMQSSSMALDKQVTPDSFGLDIVVGIGGHELSETQAQMLKRLDVVVILAYDNDIPDDFKWEQLKLFQSKTILLKSAVGFIAQSPLLGKPSEKNSPFDCGVDILMQLQVIWVDINGEFYEETMKEFLNRNHKSEYIK